MFLDKLLDQLMDSMDRGYIYDLSFYGNKLKLKLSFGIPLMNCKKEKLDALLYTIRRMTEPYYLDSTIEHQFSRVNDMVKVVITFSHPAELKDFDKEIFEKWVNGRFNIR